MDAKVFENKLMWGTKVGAPIQAKRPNSLRALHVGSSYPVRSGFPAGVEDHLRLLCENLQPEIDVEVLVPGRERQSAVEFVNQVKVERAASLFNLAAAPICPKLISALRNSHADLIHLHLTSPAALLAYLASGHQGELVITYYNDQVGKKGLSKAFEKVTHRVLNRAAAIIATSPNYIESSPVLPAHRDRCHVIPLGIPIEQYQRYDDGEVARLRERYGPRIIMSAGPLVYYKGFEYLIRAMTRVRGHLLLVGEGPFRGRLEQVVSECGLGDRVTLLGQLSTEERINCYHASDLFVLASITRRESFGIEQLEAMACGKPVINTCLDSGVPFVSQDHLTGLTVQPVDVDALAAAIRLLLSNRELRAEYGQAGLRRVREEFTVGVMVRRMLGLYSQVMEQPSRERIRKFKLAYQH